jgi:HPt (histidine-containing phosphotransfer) domain-containing protein
MKGVCQNLALTKLYTSAATLCDALRGKQDYDPVWEPMLETVKQDYDQAMGLIAQL